MVQVNVGTQLWGSHSFIHLFIHSGTEQCFFLFSVFFSSWLMCHASILADMSQNTNRLHFNFNIFASRCFPARIVLPQSIHSGRLAKITESKHGVMGAAAARRLFFFFLSRSRLLSSPPPSIAGRGSLLLSVMGILSKMLFNFGVRGCRQSL